MDRSPKRMRPRRIAPLGAHDVDVVGAHVHGDIEAGPLARHGVVAALDAHERALRDAQHVRAPRVKRCDGQRQGLRSLGGEAHRIVLGIEPREERAANDSEVGAARDRHQMLPPDGFAARFDAALVVAGPRAAEARLEQIVRRQRLEARSQ
jgi:hypothetical protein